MHRKFVKLSLVATSFSTSLLTPFVLSASNKKLQETTTPATPNTPSTPRTQDPSKPLKKHVSPIFSRFAGEADRIRKEALTKVINRAIEVFNNKYKAISDYSKKDFNKEIVAKAIYYKELVNFLTKNKDKIIENPFDYNLFFLTPFTISRNKKLDQGDIKYDSKLYNNIKFGSDGEVNDPNYNKLVELYKKQLQDSKLEKPNQIDNTLEYKEFTQFINGYYDKLNAKIIEIISQEKDELKAKDIKFSQTEKGVEVNLDDWKKKNKDFETYFKNNFTKRSIHFDLEQNQNLKIEQEEKQKKKDQQKQPTPPTLDKLPTPPTLVPGEGTNAPVEPPVINTVVESLPTLKPFVNPEYADKDLSTIKSTFDALINNAKDDASKQKASDSVFFFNNPINTRISYWVEKVELGTDKDNNNKRILRAYVKLKDRVPNSDQTFSSRSYSETVISDYFNPSKDKVAQATIYKAQIEAIKETFAKFYDALLLDDTIDYNKFRNNELSLAVSSMVDLAIKIVEGTEIKFPSGINGDDKTTSNVANNQFKVIQKEAVDKFVDYFDTEDVENNEQLIQDVKSDIIYTFLNALKSSIINNYSYFNYLAHIINANDGIVSFIATAAKVNREQFIIKNFEDNDLDIDVIDKLIRYTNRDVQNYKAIATSSPANLTKWYKNMLKYLKSINLNTKILAVLATNRLTNDDKKLDPNYTKVTQQNAVQKSALGLSRFNLLLQEPGQKDKDTTPQTNKPDTNKQQPIRYIYRPDFLKAYDEALERIAEYEKRSFDTLSTPAYSLIAIGAVLLLLITIIGGIYVSKNKNAKAIALYATTITLSILVIAIGATLILLSLI